MRQTTLSVALDVKPESCARLSGLLDELHDRRSQDPAGGTGPFAAFLDTVPALHFMSLSLFPGYDYDPLLVIEANFDGGPGPFWAQLEGAIGPELRRFLACCKRPLDRDGPLFDAVTKNDSRAPIAPYLEARSLMPTAFHHGNRGLSRDRILDESRLFKATRAELAANDAAYRKLDAPRVHGQLRAALVGKFPWLDDDSQPRIGRWENVTDWLKLGAFAFGAIFALSLPGLALAPIMPANRYLLLVGALFIGLAAWLGRIAGPLPGTGARASSPSAGAPIGLFLLVLVVLASYVLVAGALGTPISMLLTGQDGPQAWRGMRDWLLLGLPGAVVSTIGILVWLRTLERGDSSQDAPPVDPHFLREMARREDWIPQNHMGSIVLIKPGGVRAILIRAGHLGLGLFLRVTARDGYLGSMRTIHFAHWALVNNRSRLMFFSNFDQTWESYLDDFIEKAHDGLTLAWSCGVGFPPTRFLIYGGASRGRQFKEWARHSMAISHFWYSAYKELSTEQIERNFLIALGLRKKALDQEEAAAWITHL